MDADECTKWVWRDTALKKVCRLLAAACYCVDVRINRMVHQLFRGRSNYELRGTCTRCGACCNVPGVALPPLMYHVPTVRRAFVWWQVHINGFEYLSEDRRSHTFMFRCRHYDPVERCCRSYRTRPGMCRDYPRGLAMLSNPEFLDGCGHYAHYRNADEMRRALVEQGVPESTIAELEERLHLRD